LRGRTLYYAQTSKPLAGFYRLLNSAAFMLIGPLPQLHLMVCCSLCLAERFSAVLSALGANSVRSHFRVLVVLPVTLPAWLQTQAHIIVLPLPCSALVADMLENSGGTPTVFSQCCMVAPIYSGWRVEHLETSLLILTRETESGDKYSASLTHTV
ncbi:hypothetical protein XENOCAPTIV_020361, partial [Xenoophorus captivus]